MFLMLYKHTTDLITNIIHLSPYWHKLNVFIPCDIYAKIHLIFSNLQINTNSRNKNFFVTMIIISIYFRLSSIIIIKFFADAIVIYFFSKKLPDCLKLLLKQLKNKHRSYKTNAQFNDIHIFPPSSKFAYLNYK